MWLDENHTAYCEGQWKLQFYPWYTRSLLTLVSVTLTRTREILPYDKGELLCTVQFFYGLPIQQEDILKALGCLLYAINPMKFDKECCNCNSGVHNVLLLTQILHKRLSIIFAVPKPEIKQ